MVSDAWHKIGRRKKLKRRTQMKNTMKKTNLISMSLIAALALSACQPNKHNKSNTQKSTTVTVQAEKMDAQELAHAAEQLVGPYTFMIASRVANEALQKDPHNLKALFISKLLKRFEAFRGIYTRLRSYLKADQLAEFDKWIQEFPESPMKRYLTAPGKPIHTVTDLQDVLSQYYSGIEEFREFLKQNQGSEFDIELNANVFEQEIRREMYNKCQTATVGDEVTVNCDYSDIAKKKINSADMIALRQMISGELLIGIFYNSYSLEGVEKINDDNLTPQQKTEILMNTPTFGHLRSQNSFKLLRDIGSDLSSAVKWAVQYQKNLCPQGVETEYQRRGYLFEQGLCVDSTSTVLQRFMATLDQALGGITKIDMEKSDGTLVPMNVNLFAWSTKPIQDLRQIAPVGWNSCGLATSLRDNTLGGMFVDNNYNVLMDTDCNQ